MNKIMMLAIADNGVIGLNNDLPWHLPEDLKYFKECTQGKAIILGRNTWESFGSKPLPNRAHYVVATYPENIKGEGYTYAESLSHAIEQAEKDGHDTVFFVGGQRIYADAFHLCDSVYVTRVHTRVNAQQPGDVLVMTILPLTPRLWDKVESTMRVTSSNKNPGLSFTIEKWNRR